ncbi:MAG TPA: transposase [Candidatus Egerieisoma faecipullorum]|uniref:Transposase n=1 Tax=Candidatus Egerieisoma faecipullorum TaxID=2840963 RepID=A0A9D1I6B5_9CLOT|nr:transposase [Candidatus Egerieisoma faecipullorum]
MNYTAEFKKKIVRLHEEERRTYKSIPAEYGVSRASISKWCSQLREEYDYMKGMRKLRKETEELRKENFFLKKAAAFFAKEID